jgi:hypothetical protein
VIISDLTGFILARLDEDEQDARLFHEFTCAAHEQQARDGFPGTWRRCPARQAASICSDPGGLVRLSCSS